MFPLMIALTDRNNDVCYVNAQHIMSVADDPDSTGSLIYAIDGENEFVAKESVDTVIRLINNASNDQSNKLARSFLFLVGARP